MAAVAGAAAWHLHTGRKGTPPPRSRARASSSAAAAAACAAPPSPGSGCLSAWVQVTTRLAGRDLALSASL